MDDVRIEASSATTLRIGGRDWLSFAGCGYLGLGHHPEVIDAVHRELTRSGVSVAASRVTAGAHAAYEELEHTLAEFLGVDAVALLPDGYVAAAAAVHSLPATVEVAMIDPAAHPCLWHAARAAGKSCHSLADVAGSSAKVWMTDGVVPAECRQLDLRSFLVRVDLADVVIVDDSHATGVVGARGRGSLDALERSRSDLMIVGSLAKAIGCAGGFVAGSRDRIDAVRATAAYVGTTPIPPAVARAAIVAVRILRDDPTRLARLGENARRLAQIATRVGASADSPHLPVRVVPSGDDARSTRLRDAFAQAALFVPEVCYPDPSAPRSFRLSVTSEHRNEDLDRLSDVVDALVDR